MRLFSKIILINSSLSQKRLLFHMLCGLRGFESLKSSVADNFITVETKHLPGVAYLHVETSDRGAKAFCECKDFLGINSKTLDF